MANQVIGNIPEFTNDGGEPSKELKATALSAVEPLEEAPTGGETQEETETPTEPPTEETPDEVVESQPVDNAGELKNELLSEIEGLRDARKELIYELKDLRGQKRELKEQELKAVDDKIDDLNDLNPDDVTIIDRIIKAKGYVAKEEVDKRFFEEKKNAQIDKFFKEFPEYNETNDPDRKKFAPLLDKLSMFREPKTLDEFNEFLRLAHTSLSGNKISSGRISAIQQQQVKTAGVGAGGGQRPSSIEPFNAEKRAMFRAGGWSEEDIARMEKQNTTL